MIKKLWTWLTRNVGSQRPPLLQEQDGSPSSTAPPPPPPPRKQAPRSDAPGRVKAPEVPRAPRGLRLIQGEGGSTTPETPSDQVGLQGSEQPAPDLSEAAALEADGPEADGSEAREATGTDHPAVKLVFTDGSTSRLTASGPEGVRIRYLAENILPPEGS